MATLTEKMQEILGTEYDVKGIIEQGMNTNIFLAIHETTKEKRVIKHAHKKEDKEILRSAYIHRQLNHPNIVKLIDVKDKNSILIMEYIEGETLNKKIENLILEEDFIIRILDQVSNGLDYLHHVVCDSFDYISKFVDKKDQEKEFHPHHGDVSLNNIIITEKGCAKITDFGTAGHTRKTSQVTEGYMSPEQVGFVNNGNIGRVSDIYSLGATLYYLFTHESPFKEALLIPSRMPMYEKINSIQQELDKKEVLTERLKNKSKCEISDDMINIIENCMKYNPKRRYNSSQLRDAVQNLMKKRKIPTKEEIKEKAKEEKIYGDKLDNKIKSLYNSITIKWPKKYGVSDSTYTIETRMKNQQMLHDRLRYNELNENQIKLIEKADMCIDETLYFDIRKIKSFVESLDEEGKVNSDEKIILNALTPEQYSQRKHYIEIIKEGWGKGFSEQSKAEANHGDINKAFDLKKKSERILTGKTWDDYIGNNPKYKKLKRNK